MFLQKRLIMELEKAKITFDSEYKIRVLDPVKFQKGEELEKECSSFVDKVVTFSEKVNSLVEVLESHAQRIDAQKLRVCTFSTNAAFLHAYLNGFLHFTLRFSGHRIENGIIQGN